MAGMGYQWVAGLVVGWCGSGLAGRCWVLVQRYSSLGRTVRAGYGRGGGCAVVVAVPLVVVAAVVVAAVVVAAVVVAAVVVVAVFFLVATCRFKDTGWVSLFEAGKMREMGHDTCRGLFL